MELHSCTIAGKVKVTIWAMSLTIILHMHDYVYECYLTFHNCRNFKVLHPLKFYIKCKDTFPLLFCSIS